jgi:hypothetical protein
LLGWTLFDPSPIFPELSRADLLTFFEVVPNDPDLVNEWTGLLAAFEQALAERERLHCPNLFSAFVQIENPTQDIATLLTQYTLWAEERAFTPSLIHEAHAEDGEPAQATLHIDGPFAFGRLCESGPQEPGVSIIPDIDDLTMPPFADADLHRYTRRHNDRSGHT